jgi:hypothetical protein
MKRPEYAPDPEVEADRRRRAFAPREHSIDADPSTNAADPKLVKLYARKPEPIIEQWPCRGGCGATINVTATMIEHVREANRALKQRGIAPITKREVFPCPACRRREEQQIAAERAEAERRSRVRRQGAQLALGVTTTNTKPRNEL